MNKKIILLLVAIIPIFLLAIFVNITNAQSNSTAVNFMQTIFSMNPVVEVGDLLPVSDTDIGNDITANQKVINLKNYKIVFPEEKPNDTSYRPIKYTDSSVNSFEGKVNEPESWVLLVLNPGNIYIPLKSNAYGYWSWDNVGMPLTQEQYTLTVYNIGAPDVNGERSVFVQKHFINYQEAAEEIKNAPVLEINDTDSVRGEFAVDDISSLCLFNLTLDNTSYRFDPGEEVKLKLQVYTPDVCNGLKGNINYQIYNEDETQPVSEFFDTNVVFTKLDTYIKKIILNQTVQAGDYLIKSMANINNKKYLQAVGFTINPAQFILLYGETMKISKVSGLITFNFLIFLSIVVILLIIALFEFQRLFICTPMDEDDFIKRGYIKPKKLINKIK